MEWNWAFVVLLAFRLAISIASGSDMEELQNMRIANLTKELEEISKSYAEMKEIIGHLTAAKLKEKESELGIQNVIADSIANLTKDIQEIKYDVLSSKDLLNVTSLAIRKMKKRAEIRPPRREELKRKYEEKLFELLAEKMLNVEAIENLIEDGVNTSAVNGEGMTGLHQLAKYSNEKENVMEVASLLVDRGIHVNSKDEKGWNALHLFSKFYQKDDLIDVIRLLIENGADVNANTNNGSTAIALVWSNYNKENKNEIRKIFCKPIPKEEDKPWLEWRIRYKLSLLMKEKNPSLIEIECLIDQGADVNPVKRYGDKTLLHELTLYSNDKVNLIEAVQLLLGRGANVNAKDNNGWTALHNVCRWYQQENLIDVIRLLIESGADVKEKTNKEETARSLAWVHYDKENNKNEILKLLG